MFPFLGRSAEPLDCKLPQTALGELCNDKHHPVPAAEDITPPSSMAARVQLLFINLESRAATRVELLNFPGLWSAHTLR
jgi:hypothetical protein